MLKNLSIKKQLMSVPLILIVAFIYLYYSISSDLNRLEDKSLKASKANKIIKNMLEARIDEKNFIITKKIKYTDSLIKKVNLNLKISKNLKESFQDNQNRELVNKVIKNIKQYLSLFRQYSNVSLNALKEKKILAKEAKNIENIAVKVRMIQKRQRDNIIKSTNDINAIADEIEEASLANKIIKKLMTIRLNEKDYTLTKDNIYKTKIENDIKNLFILLNHTKNKIDNIKYKKMIEDMISSLINYKKSLHAFIELIKRSIYLLNKMNIEATESKEALIALRKDQKNEKNILIKNMKIQISTVFIVVSLIIVLYLLVISSFIIKNLDTINKATKELASREGDLTKRININGNNEISNISEHINSFIKKVQNAIVEAKNVASEASSISNELSYTSVEIGKRVEDESMLVKMINTNTKQTTQEAEFVDNSVQKMHEISDKSYKSLSDAIEKINNLIETVKDSSIKENELSGKMEGLKTSTDDIRNILNIIGDIADQTNLLSLNAAIEAARAGEHGRGFAVVADEVRKLAERTQKSLVEINSTINIVTQAVTEASDSMIENAQSIEVAADSATDIEKSIDDVINSIQETKAMSIESSRAVDKLKDKILEISKKMSELNDVSLSNARSVEEIASAAEHQNEIIQKLSIQLKGFQT